MGSNSSPALWGLLAAMGLLSLTVAGLPEPPPLVTPAELEQQPVESVVDLHGICLGGRTLTSGRLFLLLGDPVKAYSVPVFLSGEGEELAALDIGLGVTVRGRRIALEDGPGLRADWAGVRISTAPAPETTLRAILTFPELYRGERLELRGTWIAPTQADLDSSETGATLAAGEFTLSLVVPAELLEGVLLSTGDLVRASGEFAYEPGQGRWILRVSSLEVERSA